MSKNLTFHLLSRFAHTAIYYYGKNKLLNTEFVIYAAAIDSNKYISLCEQGSYFISGIFSQSFSYPKDIECCIVFVGAPFSFCFHYNASIMSARFENPQKEKFLLLRVMLKYIRSI